MGYGKFIEVGRVCMCNFGTDYGKLVVVVNVLDHNRALVQGPGFKRTQYLLKRLSITQLKIDIHHCSKSSTVDKKLAETDIQAAFDATTWGKTLKQRSTRRSLTDFQRFQVTIAKQKRNKAINKIVKAKLA